jgi:TolB-like protein
LDSMGRDEVHFGRFRLDLGQRKLAREGESVPLGSRALDILCVLASAKGEVVSKDELMARVWPGIIVEENNIQVHVSALRKALGEGTTGQSYLMTVPGRGYRLIGLRPAPWPNTEDSGARSGPALPDRPSIAVLPFQNMTGDSEHDYFADGIVEEIITALSRFRQLFVIARNSSFTYKGRPVNVKQAGVELGVRYVLEGSVRKSAKQVRITGQLIDASSGTHIWAERFDGRIEDIFDLQDRVTTGVVAAMAPKIEQAEIERSKRKPTNSLDAYDYYLRGRAEYYKRAREPNKEALTLFCRAIELDRDFAAAYGMAALCYAQRKTGGWSTGGQREVAEAVRLAERAVELGRDDAVALSSAGFARARVAGDLPAGLTLVERALVLNPNLAPAWYYYSWVRIWNGEPELALEHLKHVARLSPNDPIMTIQTATAFAHFFAGRYHEASYAARRALLDNPNWHPALRVLAASCALADRMDDAKSAIAELRQIDPTLRVSGLQHALTFRRPEDFDKYVAGLRKAGLPE